MHFYTGIIASTMKLGVAILIILVLCNIFHPRISKQFSKRLNIIPISPTGCRYVPFIISRLVEELVAEPQSSELCSSLPMSKPHCIFGTVEVIEVSSVDKTSVPISLRIWSDKVLWTCRTKVTCLSVRRIQTLSYLCYLSCFSLKNQQAITRMCFNQCPLI